MSKYIDVSNCIAIYDHAKENRSTIEIENFNTRYTSDPVTLTLTITMPRNEFDSFIKKSKDKKKSLLDIFRTLLKNSASRVR